jgi:hypothetical protein
MGNQRTQVDDTQLEFDNAGASATLGTRCRRDRTRMWSCPGKAAVDRTAVVIANHPPPFRADHRCDDCPRQGRWDEVPADDLARVLVQTHQGGHLDAQLSH